MKRGFLKGSSMSGSREGQSFEPKVSKLSYGVVKDAGKPEGYKAEDPVLKELDGNLLDHDENPILMTTIPGRNFGDTNADHPEGTCELICDSYTKKKILTQPEFPKPLQQPTEKLYRIGPSSLGGLGMFATADISMGDLVLSERPLMLSPAAGPTYCNVQTPKHFTQEQVRQAMIFEYEKMLKASFGRMDREDQRAFLSLHNCHKHDGSGPIFGVIRTNGFQVSRDISFMKNVGLVPEEYTGYTAVCKDMSRINHSCRPNVTRFFDMPSFAFQVHATRDIKCDEEITTSYCVLLNMASERATELAPYGIDKCACSACGDAKTSDGRRAKIVPKPDSFTNGRDLLKGGGDRIKKAERDILEQIDLLEKESLQAEACYGTYLNKLSSVYMLQQKTDKLQENVKKMQYLANAKIGSPSFMIF